MKPAQHQSDRRGRRFALPARITPRSRGRARLLLRQESRVLLGPSRLCRRAVGLAVLLAAAPAWAASNLVVNGSFDNRDQPLGAWQYKYDRKGESWYFENHTRVSVVEMVNGRRGVLRLAVPNQGIADTQGTKVDSQPIPVKPGGRYRMSAWARTTGPNCQLLMEGYKWRPRTKPHPNPTLYELRKCYTFRQLFFGREEGGTMGNPSESWRRASMTVPEGVKQLEGLRQKKFNEIEFLVIHLVAIGGKAGDLFVDDVVLERVD